MILFKFQDVSYFGGFFASIYCRKCFILGLYFRVFNSMLPPFFCIHEAVFKTFMVME